MRGWRDPRGCSFAAFPGTRQSHYLPPPLRILQGDGASADLSVEVVLDQNPSRETRAPLGGFGPQVGDIVASPYLEGHEVVDFILAGSSAQLSRIRGTPDD